MTSPAGYRKAVRLIRLADRLGYPIITCIDTPGADVQQRAEEQNQSYAIAHCIDALLAARVPTLAVVVGEGMSGGAIALAATDHLAMLQHAVLSVISPEGCAAILAKDAKQASCYAEKLRITAPFLFEQGLIDAIIEEPLGGAHRQPNLAVQIIRGHLIGQLQRLCANYSRFGQDRWLSQRHERMTKFGIQHSL